jgi:divalent metal cation (Fe/Co/Zn/Cd) transporter
MSDLLVIIAALALLLIRWMWWIAKAALAFLIALWILNALGLVCARVAS